MPGDLLKVATENTSKLDLSLKFAFPSSPVTYGGPVLTDEFQILHGYGAVEGAQTVCPGVYVGGWEELMNQVRMQRLDPSKALFVKGHAAWVPGQLERELGKGVWYIASVSSDFILRHAHPPQDTGSDDSDLWTDILNCMGDSFASIANKHGGTTNEKNDLMP
jgi:putative transcriptional regulator